MLYHPKRLAKIRTHLSSIDTLMNLDRSRPLPAGDTRIEAGAGPNWLIRATGRIAPPVLEAADRCDAIAALLDETRRELENVAMPRSDKRHLLNALDEESAAWSERAKLWRDPRRPRDGAAAAVASHTRASVREYHRVRTYLKRVDLRSLD